MSAQPGLSASLAIRMLSWPQYILPKKLLTRLAWRLSTCRWRWLNQPLMRVFAQMFQVRLDEAERGDIADYDCFNDFFTRALKPDARPLADDVALISPCDGTISQVGNIDGQSIIQAKGHRYSATALLGGEDWAKPFENGRFITIYLAPSDYHRVHTPIAGKLVGERRIAGELFSVSDATTRAIPDLFARNERLVALMDTEQGPVAVVMVAALLVAGIETVWGGPTDRRPGPGIETRTPAGVELARGGELGRFHWGSTAIVLTPPGAPEWRESLSAGRRIRLGQALTEHPS
ncbi:MAG: archaetidylserine decarboxylase [Pseudomonadota bacterium]